MGRAVASPSTEVLCGGTAQGVPTCGPPGPVEGAAAWGVRQEAALRLCRFDRSIHDVSPALPWECKERIGPHGENQQEQLAATCL